MYIYLIKSNWCIFPVWKWDKKKSWTQDTKKTVLSLQLYSKMDRNIIKDILIWCLSFAIYHSWYPVQYLAHAHCRKNDRYHFWLVLYVKITSWVFVYMWKNLLSTLRLMDFVIRSSSHTTFLSYNNTRKPYHVWFFSMCNIIFA